MSDRLYQDGDILVSVLRPRRARIWPEFAHFSPVWTLA